MLSSCGQRVLWLLEELGLPYDVKRYARDPQTAFAPPELLQVHPLGKSPVIEDAGTVFAETGAIVEHLVERAGGALRPPAGSDERRRWTYWLHFAEGSAMPLQVRSFLFNRVRSAPAPFDATPVEQVIDGYLQPNIDRRVPRPHPRTTGVPACTRTRRGICSAALRSLHPHLVTGVGASPGGKARG